MVAGIEAGKRVFVDLNGSLFKLPDSEQLPTRFYIKEPLDPTEKSRLMRALPQNGDFAQGLTEMLSPLSQPLTFSGWLSQIRRGYWQEAILDVMPGPKGPLVTGGISEAVSAMARQCIMGYKARDYAQETVDAFQLNQGMVEGIKEVVEQEGAKVTVCTNISYIMNRRVRGKLGDVWGVLDPTIPAIHKPVDVGTSALLKLAVCSLWPSSEDIYFVDDDLYIVGQLRELCKAVYVPLTQEQALRQPPLQQEALSQILAEKDPRVIFKEGFDRDGIHRLIAR